MSVRKQTSLLITLMLLCGSVSAADTDKKDASTDSASASKRSHQGQSIKAKKSKGAKKKQKKAAAAFRKSKPIALAFAREHHPELAELLEKLQQNKRSQYRNAIRGLARDAKRLQRVRKQSPQRYETSLAGWKLDSRIRLLAAKMTMIEDPALEEKLEKLLEKRVTLRLRQLKADRDRFAKRVNKIEEAIARINSDPKAAAQRDLKRVKKSLKGKHRKSKQRNAKRKAAKSGQRTAKKSGRKKKAKSKTAPKQAGGKAANGK